MIFHTKVYTVPYMIGCTAIQGNQPDTYISSPSTRLSNQHRLLKDLDTARAKLTVLATAAVVGAHIYKMALT